MTQSRRLLSVSALVIAGITGCGAMSSAHADDSTASSAQATSGTVAEVRGTLGCRPGERWDFGSGVPQESIEQFRLFLGKKEPTVRGFAEALALRRKAANPVQKYFAEYWVSRSLYGSNLVHIAENGFTVLASRPVSDATIGIQLEALECLSEIHSRFPAITIPKRVIERIPSYLAAAKKISHVQPVWDLVTLYALDRLNRDKNVSPTEADRILGWLSGSGAHEELIQGLFAAQRSDFSTTIISLKKFLADSRPHLLNRFVDAAQILVARSYYSVGNFQAAINHFKMVSKSSNELANSLQELSWAYLMDEKYREAIGTAMNLQAGGLRNTFTPEAPMVMAMAMNEICQYPQSVNAANLFRKNYGKSFKWLDQWKSSGKTQNLYKLAVKYMKKQGNTPVRIASEWVRSPLFISDQDEINLLFDERDAAKRLSQWGSHVQNQLGQAILDNLKDLKPDFYAAKAKLKPGEELPYAIKQRLAKLRQDVIAFRRMQKAAPIWKAVLAHHQQVAPLIENRLAQEINDDLKVRSQRMLTQLDETAENVQLIEVEIYNGASQDIIWQNAHPGYKKMARQLDTDTDRAPASEVWDWGKTKIATDDEQVEVWEDELGSFKADLVDNCASKDKYLALRFHRKRQASKSQ